MIWISVFFVALLAKSVISEDVLCAEKLEQNSVLSQAQVSIHPFASKRVCLISDAKRLA